MEKNWLHATIGKYKCKASLVQGQDFFRLTKQTRFRYLPDNKNLTVRVIQDQKRNFFANIIRRHLAKSFILLKGSALGPSTETRVPNFFFFFYVWP